MPRSVRALPRGTLIFTRPFTAQPVPSRRGPRVRWRSLRNAMSIDGPEMRSSRTTTTRGFSHKGMFSMPLNTAARATPIALTARPTAAKMPANFAMSKDDGGDGGGTGCTTWTASVAAAVTALFRPVAAILSLDAENLENWSPTNEATFLYGAQNDCLMLMGLATIYLGGLLGRGGHGLVQAGRGDLVLGRGKLGELVADERGHLLLRRPVLQVFR